MAVEIDNVLTLSGALTISDEGVKWLKVDAPDIEGCPSCTVRGGTNHVEMDWTWEGSRDGMVDGSLATFFAFTKGTAEFVLIAENGELFGLAVNDGQMMWRKVVFALGDPHRAPRERWRREEV